MTTPVIEQVYAEWVSQNKKLGNPAHDDSLPILAMIQAIEDYAAWARRMFAQSKIIKGEERLIQVAALAVATVESSRRRRNV